MCLYACFKPIQNLLLGINKSNTNEEGYDITPLGANNRLYLLFRALSMMNTQKRLANFTIRRT